MPRGMSALRLKQLLHRSIVRHFSYKAPLIFEKAVNYPLFRASERRKCKIVLCFLRFCIIIIQVY